MSEYSDAPSMGAVGSSVRTMWHPWLVLDRRIRALLAQRMERGASDKLDRLLARAIGDVRRLERRPWWN